MTQIISYQKVTDEYTTYRLRLPDDGDGNHMGTELATIDGITYVAIPDGVTLPEQPDAIAASVTTVTLDVALRLKIKTASPHCRLIAERMQEKIRAAYSAEDETYITRIAVADVRGTYTLEPGEDALIDDYQTYIEDVRQWGRDERAKLGL